MRARAQKYFAQLSERERRLVVIGAIAAVLLIVVAAVLPLQRSVSAVQQRVERKRDDLSWLRSMAPQLAVLQNSARPELREPLVVLVDRTSREAGLQKGSFGSQPSGDGGVSVRLDQTPFDQLVAWLSSLNERYGVRVQSASIDVGTGVGTVNVSLVLHAG